MDRSNFFELMRPITGRGRVQAGFTLIELMLVVVLAGIMLGIGIPSFRDFIASQRVKAAAGEYATALVEARSEAIKRNSPSASPTSVDAIGGNWQNGWRLLSGGATLSEQAAYAGLTFTCPTMTGAVCAASIQYIGSGRLLNLNQPKLQITGLDGSVRCVAIDLSGMPRSTKGACT